MYKAWALHNPTTVYFGAGVRRKLVELVDGRDCLVVTSERGRHQICTDAALAKANLAKNATWMTEVVPQPDLASLQRIIDSLAERRFDAIVAFGGGSAIDTAKALALCMAPEAPSRDLARLIDSPPSGPTAKALPIHALPTTSGTGAEVTPFATIWDNIRKKKLSLDSEAVFPRTALTDPQLTHGLPWSITLSTGLDALNQAFEAVWNRNVSNFILPLAAQAVRLAFSALPKLKQDQDDADARAALSEASLLAGFCISQTRTAICHAMSYPLSLHYNLPHGLACAFSMRGVAELCLQKNVPTYQKLAEYAGLRTSQALTDAVVCLFEELDVNPHIRKNLPDVDSLLSLSGEMHTTSRSDNFIVDIDQSLLHNLIRNSHETLLHTSKITTGPEQ